MLPEMFSPICSAGPCRLLRYYKFVLRILTVFKSPDINFFVLLDQATMPAESAEPSVIFLSASLNCSIVFQYVFSICIRIFYHNKFLSNCCFNVSILFKLLSPSNFCCRFNCRCFFSISNTNSVLECKYVC